MAFTPGWSSSGLEGVVGNADESTLFGLGFLRVTLVRLAALDQLVQ